MSPSDPSPTERSEEAAAQRALLATLGLPSPVRTVLEARLTPSRQPAPTLTEPQPLHRSWRLVPDAAGGWLLLRDAPQDDPHAVRTGAQPWAAGDRWGWLHLAVAWDGGALRRAWLRLPAPAWLELRPRAGTHPLWGAADALVHHPCGWSGPGDGAGPPVGLLPALEYGALDALPPFDRPAALPPGAGGAVLNLLAHLCVAQGRARIAYRGPYPTPALFATLCRSFVPEGPLAEAAARFVRDETALAFRGRLADNPVQWRPAPFAPCRPAPALLAHLREGVESAWVHDVPFRRAAIGGVAADGVALPAGERIWREGPAHDPALAVGLALLGRPYARFFRLAPDGAVRAAAPIGLETAAVEAPAASLDERWRAVLWPWATLRAHEGLAAALAAQEATVPARWCALPLRLAELRDGALCVHRALALEFLRRAREEDGAGLAVMLVSDVLEAVTPSLLRHAQGTLEQARDTGGAGSGQDVAALLDAGRAAQAAARARLERALPVLIRALAAGEALPEGVGG